MKILTLFLLFYTTLLCAEYEALKIIQKPIIFEKERIELTKSYIKEHYGFAVKTIEIEPKIVVIHWTAVMDLQKSYELLKPQKLLSHRGDIASAGALNVSAHFMVDRDGTIYQLMPENWMARHVIGLNYSSIGIENIGGEGNQKEDLTEAQLEANAALVRYLHHKYSSIEYMIGHSEYLDMQNSPLWLERDPTYRTEKNDPGEIFLNNLRSKLRNLGLKSTKSYTENKH